MNGFNEITRRKVLGGLCAASVGSVAGCLDGFVGSEGGYRTEAGECSVSKIDPSSRTGWRVSRGDVANTASSTMSLGGTEAPLSRSWEVDIGKSPLLTPVVINGFIAVLSTEPDGVTTAINEAGEALWTESRDELGGDVALNSETVYAGYEHNGDGVDVIASELSSGEIRSQFTEIGSASRVVPLEHRIIVAGNDTVIGYDRQQQSACWRYRAKGPDPRVSGVAARGKTVYVGVVTRESDVEDGGGVAAVGPSGVTWQRSVNEPVVGLTLGVDRTFVRTSSAVIALRRSTGETDWRYELGGHPKHGMSLKDGALVVGDYYGIASLRPEDGKERWSTELGSTDHSPVILKDGIVATGRSSSAENGVLVVLDAAGSVGQRIKIRGNRVSSPAVAGGRVYVGTNDGRLLSFEGS